MTHTDKNGNIVVTGARVSFPGLFEKPKVAVTFDVRFDPVSMARVDATTAKLRDLLPTKDIGTKRYADIRDLILWANWYYSEDPQIPCKASDNMLAGHFEFYEMIIEEYS